MKTFPEQVRIDAVKRVLVNGETIRAVAQGVGVSESTLHRWQERYGRSLSESNSKERDEIRLLKRQIEEMTQEVEILRKVEDYFKKRS